MHMQADALGHKEAEVDLISSRHAADGLERERVRIVLQAARCMFVGSATVDIGTATLARDHVPQVSSERLTAAEKRVREVEGQLDTLRSQNSELRTAFVELQATEQRLRNDAFAKNSASSIEVEECVRTCE
jgi:hypothetical protein